MLRLTARRLRLLPTSPLVNPTSSAFARLEPWNTNWSSRRTIFGLPTPSNEPLAGTIDGSGPPWLFLVQILVGFPTALWFYKCLIMILFQRRIIYLPSVPPGGRNETLSPPGKELASQLNGLDWKEIKIETRNKTRVLRQPIKLRGIELSLPRPAATSIPSKVDGRIPVVLIYLQGNAGGPLLRVPLFRRLLSPRPPSIDLTILCVAPRSYRLSTRTTPTERGILQDYSAVLSHAFATHDDPRTQFYLYGHSLGGAAAILLTRSTDIRSRIAGVILENPLPSIPRMLRALYVEKWLPYRYLGPFVFDRWDTEKAVQEEMALKGMRTFWLRSGKDEIVPEGEVESMFGRVESMNGRESSEFVYLRDSLHDNAYMIKDWRSSIIKFLKHSET